MPLLASDEPNIMGVSRDSYEGVGYMDFTLSLRYPLLYDTLEQGNKFNMLPFFSFTGRGAQYILTRHSAPVVAKRFNPKLFLRFYTLTEPGEHLWADDARLDYFDVGYGHESNGQYVDSPALFASQSASVGGDANARDYISRGWDYLGYRHHLYLESFGLYTIDAEVRYFLDHGLLQRSIEEYYAWEGPHNITRISQVDGLRLRLNFEFRRDWFKGASVLLMTGYRNFGRWNTVRAELGFTPLSDFLGVPIMFWAQDGYNSSVTQYYRQCWSAGVAVVFETFK
jgi:hypothetical protein